MKQYLHRPGFQGIQPNKKKIQRREIFDHKKEFKNFIENLIFPKQPNLKTQECSQNVSKKNKKCRPNISSAF